MEDHQLLVNSFRSIFIYLLRDLCGYGLKPTALKVTLQKDGFRDNPSAGHFRSSMHQGVANNHSILAMVLTSKM